MKSVYNQLKSWETYLWYFTNCGRKGNLENGINEYLRPVFCNYYENLIILRNRCNLL